MSQDNELSNIVRDLEKIENSENKFSDEEKSDLHGRIIQLPRTDRRQLYESKEYVLLERVLDWQKTCPQDKQTTDVRNKTDEDINHATEINTKVAISKEKWDQIECDAVLVGAEFQYTSIPHPTYGSMFLVDTVTMGVNGYFKVKGGFRLPANYVFLTEDGGQDHNIITEFLKNSVKLGHKSLTLEWPFYEREDQDQHSSCLTAVMAAVKTWLEDNYESVDKIIFCAGHNASYDNLIPELFPAYRLEPDTPREVVEAGFNRVVEAIRDLTNKICDAIAGRNAELTKQLDSNRKTKRRDESDETSPIKKIEEEN